jgi:hypothetical protein
MLSDIYGNKSLSVSVKLFLRRFVDTRSGYDTVHRVNRIHMHTTTQQWIDQF